MIENMILVRNFDGTYDVVIDINEYDTEFGLDFFATEKVQDSYKNIHEFIEKHAKGLKVSAVKIMAGGLLLSAIPFSTIVNAASSESPDPNVSMCCEYDSLYQGGPAVAVTNIKLVKDAIANALPQTYKEKIIAGIPLYGRIWSINDTSFVGKEVSLEVIGELVHEYHAVVSFDKESQSPKAEFEIKRTDKQIVVDGKILAPGKYLVKFYTPAWM
jgi:hypothetical protein